MFSLVSGRLSLVLFVGTLLARAFATTVHAVEPSPDRAVPIPRATPGTGPASGVGDEQITILNVSTEQYPKLVARFSFEPIEGDPPPYLEPREILMTDGGVIAEPQEVFTVNRVPTNKVGTYEVVWQARAVADPGQAVVVRMAISVRGRPEISTETRYVRPMPRLATPAAGDQQPTVPLTAVPAADPNAIDIPLSSAIAAVFAGTGLICLMAALIWRAHVRRAQERLAIWVMGSAPDRAKAAARANSARKQITISPLVQFFGRIGTKLVPSNQADKLKRQLILAGRPTSQDYTKLVAQKAGYSIALFLIGFWLMISLGPIYTTLAVSLCMATMGYILPTMALKRATKKRQYELRKSLPDALDLMTIGVSAGLAFDGAIGEIVEKWDNELSREYAVMLGELRIGTGRREALLNLADRTQVEEIQTMVSQLIQADELGMSLTDTLLTLANQMRLRRRQHAEELAQKAAIKMLIPLVFLIFPALFVVILGPAAQDMYSFFVDGPGGK